MNLNLGFRRMQLVPGLPNDLAYQCLLRLPYLHLRRLCVVSKLWHSVLTDPKFFKTRRDSRLDKPLLCALVSDFSFHIQLLICDPDYDIWYKAPPLPQIPQATSSGFRSQILDGGRKLALCGGWRRQTLKSLTLFDFWTCKWTVASPMKTSRAHFASGVIDNKLYAAGGLSDEKPRSKTVECYDPEADRWETRAPVPEDISFCSSLVFHHCLYVRARGGQPRSTYVFGDGVWATESIGEGGRLRRPESLLIDVAYAGLGNSVFMIENGGLNTLRVYDLKRREWDCVHPDGFSGDFSEKFVARCFLADERGEKLWGVDGDLSVAAVHVEGDKGRLVKLCRHHLDNPRDLVSSAHICYV